MKGIKFVPDESQKAFIRYAYNSSEYTQEEIAEQLGIDGETLRRTATKLGVTKTRKSVWTPDKIEWLKVNYNLPYKELCAHLGFHNETIRLKLKELGLVRTTRYRPFKLDMSDIEFIKDLENPTLTAPDIVEKYKDKYGIGESRIHQLRKERRIKLQVDTIHRVSISEFKVKKILEKLDVAFIQEKSIGRYHIDFYLGFKLCLEVQGRYWHSKPERQATDARKRKYLNDLGYTVIYVWDDELDTAEDKIRAILKERGLPLQ